MADRSKIEWTDATWTPIRARRRDNGKLGVHCERVSPACKNCYAATLNRRNLPSHGTGLDFTRPNREMVDVFVDEEMLLQPLRWRRGRKIFVCSQTDLFGEFVTDNMIDQVFAVMALCPQHTFQVLTKRPERMREYLTAEIPLSDRAEYVLSQAAHTGKIVWDPRGSERHNYYGCGQIGDISNRRVLPGWPLPNVWLGVTAENQEWADKRIPLLLETPAAKRFVSVEPMLGEIDLTGYVPAYHGIDERRYLDQVICGGESGSGARPLHPDWARSLRDQCQAAGVPFFFKQWGEFSPLKPNPCTHWTLIDHGGETFENTTAWNGRRGQDSETGEEYVYRVGKRAAGRLLDGREWNEFPEVQNDVR